MTETSTEIITVRDAVSSAGAEMEYTYPCACVQWGRHGSTGCTHATYFISNCCVLDTGFACMQTACFSRKKGLKRRPATLVRAATRHFAVGRRGRITGDAPARCMSRRRSTRPRTRQMAVCLTRHSARLSGSPFSSDLPRRHENQAWRSWRALQLPRSCPAEHLPMNVHIVRCAALGLTRQMQLAQQSKWIIDTMRKPDKTVWSCVRLINWHWVPVVPAQKALCSACRLHKCRKPGRTWDDHDAKSYAKVLRH